MFRSLLLIILVFTTLLAQNSCRNNKAPEPESMLDCKLGKPQAIFSPTMKGVVQHAFKQEKYRSIEKLMLADSTQVEVIQTGCAYIRQEFQITIFRDFANATDNAWKMLAINQFDKFSTVDEKLAPFAQWAIAMKQRFPELKLGESFELDKDFYVKIDKIAGDGRATLIVVFSQSPD